jgi:deaminated glutathione amidase
MENSLNVAVCQMTSVDNWQKNLNQIMDILGTIENPKSVDIICLPENSLYMHLFRNQYEKKPVGISLDNAIFEPICNYAKKYSTQVFLGSVPLRIHDRVYNSTVQIDEKGRLTHPYQKIHLFDVDVDDGKSYRESKLYDHGTTPAIVDVKGWKIGLSICYDLRFPDLYSYYARGGASLIMIPAAFTVPTGEAHWKLLLQARAIETQCYVLAAAQGGDHDGSRSTYGHSMIIDPWGTIEGEATASSPVIQWSCSKEKIAELKKSMPMESHRKFIKSE